MKRQIFFNNFSRVVKKVILEGCLCNFSSIWCQQGLFVNCKLLFKKNINTISILYSKLSHWTTCITVQSYVHVYNIFRGRRCHDRIVVILLPMQSVPITTNVSSNPTQAIQHYVIKFVSYLMAGQWFSLGILVSSIHQ